MEYEGCVAYLGERVSEIHICSDWDMGTKYGDTWRIRTEAILLRSSNNC